MANLIVLNIPTPQPNVYSGKIYIRPAAPTDVADNPDSTMIVPLYNASGQPMANPVDIQANGSIPVVQTFEGPLMLDYYDANGVMRYRVQPDNIAGETLVNNAVYKEIPATIITTGDYWVSIPLDLTALATVKYKARVWTNAKIRWSGPAGNAYFNMNVEFLYDGSDTTNTQVPPNFVQNAVATISLDYNLSSVYTNPNPSAVEWRTDYNIPAIAVNVSPSGSVNLLAMMVFSSPMRWFVDMPSSGLVGPQGEQGVIGPAGPQGIQGPQGPAGPQGPQGFTGPQGLTGPQGPTGEQGPPGLPGNLSSTWMPMTYLSLGGAVAAQQTITFDNSVLQLQQGDFIAFQIGTSGGTLYVNGTVKNPGTAAQSATFSGGTNITSIYIYNQGATVQAVINASTNFSIPSLAWAYALRGIQGPAGDQGPMGPQGPAGATGPQGLVGPQGPQGPIGPQGPAGPQGDEGLPGQTGPQGPQGNVGIPGPPGNDGPVGPQGPTGPQGIPGPAGPQGDPGPVGPQGPQGIQGPAGNSSAVSSVDFNTANNGLTITSTTGATASTVVPLATATNDGFMPRSDVQTIADLVSRVDSLEDGGVWRGTFATYAALTAAYPNLDVSGTTWSTNDFVYVQADENQGGAQTAYIVDSTKHLQFSRVITTPIATATNTSLGVVQGNTDPGTIYIETNGTMSLNGYDDLTDEIAQLSNDITTVSYAAIRLTTTPATALSTALGSSAGLQTYSARGDHQHAMPTAANMASAYGSTGAPGVLSALAGIAGISSLFARADHTHTMPSAADHNALYPPQWSRVQLPASNIPIALHLAGGSTKLVILVSNDDNTAVITAHRLNGSTITINFGPESFLLSWSGNEYYTFAVINPITDTAFTIVTADALNIINPYGSVEKISLTVK